MNGQTDPNSNWTKAAKDLFDLVIVPRGVVDVKFVIGTIGADNVPSVKASRVRSAKRIWGGKKVELPLWPPLGVAAVPASIPANDSLEAQAQGLLTQLAETLDTLASAQSAFRAELRAAIAEGDTMLTKAAG